MKVTAASYWNRMGRARISRKRVLRGAAAGAVGVAAVAAFGGGRGHAPGARASTGVVQEPVRGGRYKFATTSSWGTIDPVTSVAGPLLFPRMYNTLVSQSTRQPNVFYFDLAESLEQPDDETYVYSVRPGVTIAPNNLGIPERELDAFDAHRWMERVTQDDDAVLRFLTAPWVSSFEAPDSGTFRIDTNGPYAYFLQRLGSPLGGTIPPREFSEQGISLRNQGVGAGPFVLRPGTFNENGIASLDANPNYYRTTSGGAQLPYLAGMDALRIDDGVTRRVAFERQQIHSYAPAGRDEALDLLGQHGVFSVPEPVNTFIALIMNVKRPPWDDARIRKAAMHALNRQQYVDLVYGGDAGPNGLVHWPLGDFALPQEELEQLQAFDPALSRQLILEATGEETLPITVMYPVTDIEEHNQHLPIFVEQMLAAGFVVNQEPVDFGSWLARYTNKDYDASLVLNQIYDTPEVPLDFHHSLGPQGDGIFSNGLQDAKIDAALEQAKTVVNKTDLVNAVRDVQRQIYAAGPAFLPIVSPFTRMLHWSFVKNIPQGLGPVGLFMNEWWMGPLPDADGDGCSDAHEYGPLAAFGGQRDPDNFWDFFDTPNASNVRDGSVNAPDIARVAGRFGTTGDAGIDPLSPPSLTGYHTAFDRSVPGPNPWNAGPPTGSVSAQDIAAVVAQFGHTCVGTG